MFEHRNASVFEFEYRCRVSSFSMSGCECVRIWKELKKQ